MGQLIAVDFHCKYQKGEWVDRATGEISEADLRHDDLKEVRRLYQRFDAGSTVGMEVSGYSYWFEQIVHELGLELKVIPGGEVARRRRRRQKNDRRDVEHLLEMLVAGNVPTVFRPLPQAREGRILIRHLMRLTRERTRWINVVRALVYNYNLRVRAGGLSRAKREQIGQLEMSGRLNGLRDDVLERIEQLDRDIQHQRGQVRELAEANEAAWRLMTVLSIGPMTALYLVLTLGPVERFANARRLVGYVGLDSLEHSSDNLHKKRRYGRISKQGDRTLRWLLIQCATKACRIHPQLRRFYRRLQYRKSWAVARTAVARKLLVCCYVLLRDDIDYPEFVRRGPGLGLPVRISDPR
ncbi:IS110 family transposase [Acidobacteria bacterium AH-259-L09]|nr:IS110 family transposase [Acidobacteria bacterium AH-259-L09]